MNQINITTLAEKWLPNHAGVVQLHVHRQAFKRIIANESFWYMSMECAQHVDIGFDSRSLLSWLRT